MASAKKHSIVAIYDTHTAAETAIAALQKAGIDMRRLSIIGKGFHTEEHALGFYTVRDRIKRWAGSGALLGSLWGMLFGSAFFFLPVVGPVVVMGPLVAWMVAALEGAAVGGSVGAIAAALASIGLPADSVVKYELEVKAGKYLILVRGGADTADRARGVLEGTGATEVATHPASPESPARAPSPDDRGSPATVS
jgi:uncharacterized membrane protein